MMDLGSYTHDYRKSVALRSAALFLHLSTLFHIISCVCSCQTTPLRKTNEQKAQK